MKDCKRLLLTTLKQMSSAWMNGSWAVTAGWARLLLEQQQEQKLQGRPSWPRRPFSCGCCSCCDHPLLLVSRLRFIQVCLFWRVSIGFDWKSCDCLSVLTSRWRSEWVTLTVNNHWLTSWPLTGGLALCVCRLPGCKWKDEDPHWLLQPGLTLFLLMRLYTVHSERKGSNGRPLRSQVLYSKFMWSESGSWRVQEARTRGERVRVSFRNTRANMMSFRCMLYMWQ